MESFLGEEWSPSENEKFEEALAEFDLNGQDWLEQLNETLPATKELTDHCINFSMDLGCINNGCNLILPGIAHSNVTKDGDSGILSMDNPLQEMNGIGSSSLNATIAAKTVVMEGGSSSSIADEVITLPSSAKPETERLTSPIAATEASMEAIAPTSTKGMPWTEEEHSLSFQVNPVKYNSIFLGLNILVKEHGPSSLWRGWAGKFFGYGVQGGCKFGLYEYFKKMYSDILVGYNRSIIFFISSASAQVIADVALCPFEAVKVRVQTQPKFAKGLIDGFPRVFASEGLSGFYRGLLPLWGRNLPFSILMFSSFEHTVDILYHNVIQKKREDCSRAQQLGVTCVAGYTAGAIGTIVSNPADNIVASLYNKKANGVLQAVKSIGVLNLFTRSLPIRFTLVGPVITMQWFLYDTIKVLTGL
ncbi:putative Mitochondrial phosphate carrier protein 1, mitochondrial [Cocos nucifera]|uniref:Putative Mitochondrial phosphate carrier protein 1, mitochondrial n=1 Tax=Cocos nucifera TaxID=13894 RepID=A0A8K0IJK2_COCNU|nr:putative Mitochondrial phosphate carrier protein 1, mitochondrial [Cocos nucifera]